MKKETVNQIIKSKNIKYIPFLQNLSYKYFSSGWNL